MRIGLFTDTYYPQVNGVATSVLMLKENLETLGHQVYVFTTTDPKVAGEETNVYRVPSIPFISERRVAMLYNHRLAKLIKGLGLDLIHTHTEFSIGIFGREMAKELNIPFLHTYHTIYEDYTHYIVKLTALESIAKTAARKLSSNFCNSADEVIVPTGKVEDLLLSYGVKQNISVMPTGIKLDKFSKYSYDSNIVQNLRTALGIEAEDKCLLYVGRISKEKNIEEILIDMKSYLKDKENVKFILIGDGPEKSNLEELAKKLGIQRQTIFVGEISWDEIGMYYQIGDVFVSASQSETQGLTYIEALASGLPVVAKADRCLEGVVQNNVNGYTFHDGEEFLQSLDSILNNDLLKEQLSLGAIKSARRFSAQNFAHTVETLYKNVLLDKKEDENLLYRNMAALKFR
ncbi:glycosyltransferase family 4 protein [Clostridium magnum]|uniref:Alpha-monoglucosyldiacylglycerol synthase n=1 Tax=Clostridium magnum DSM 2767 TaxID=1121326 RepID=A0A161XBQ9_9CLOT|nr:glycosyltransferase family 4 protein [Clostridium magnum]KZL91726.1 alpha-monoglucosyldiacylglycerol synthase [Clostridium magnum DSM 2767]SHJ04156.1 1,2-diacylglycerol 3-alpha-glucosyltransferase [Clostridium magnum DSM 2767]